MTDEKNPDEIAQPFVVQTAPPLKDGAYTPYPVVEPPAQEHIAEAHMAVAALTPNQAAFVDDITIAQDQAKKLRFHRLTDEAKIPTRSYPDDVGWDVYACLISDEGRPRSMMIPSCASKRVPTGIIGIAPEGYRLELCSRSGLACSSTHPLFVANAPGVIDPGFRGEIEVILYNGGHQAYWVSHGQRIGQLVVTHAIHLECVEIDEEDIPKGSRGDAGFGSTGE